MAGWFTTKDGRRFSPEQRKASAKLTKAAVARGEIPKAEKCNRCGQTEGYVSYHNHDYASPTEFLESLCFRCHIVYHSEHFAPKECAAYFAEVAAGKMYPGTTQQSVWGAIARDHGIRHPRTKKEPELPCEKCEQAEGLMRWYGLDDTDAPTERLCYRCYNVRLARPSLAVEMYWKQVADGTRFPAVYKPDMELMWREHGIAHPPRAVDEQITLLE